MLLTMQVEQQQSQISAEEIKFLSENLGNLPPEMQEKLKSLLLQRQAGCRTNHWMRRIRPVLHPKQKMFLGLEHREVMFGGAAGGSKSDSLLLSMMQYLDEPGYCSIIFRRTFKDLSGAGSIMDRAKSWFTPWEADGVRWSSADNSFYFPTGKGKQPSRFAFAYLQHDDDKRNYQGWELNACVKTTTKVIMGDGSRKTVARIQVGDIVATPEGPRPVTKVWEPERKKCVEIQVFDALGRLAGSQTQSLDHAFMSNSGWISYDSIESSEPSQLSYQHRSAWQPGPRFRSTSQNHGSQSGRRQQQFSLAQSRSRFSGQLDSFASSAMNRNDFGESDDLPQEHWPLLGLCGPLMLFSPYPRSASGAVRRHDVEHASVASLAQDSQSYCPSCFHFCDEPPRRVQFFGQDERPSQFGAETPTRRLLSSDDMERIHERNLLSSSRCCHQGQTETEYLESSQLCVFSANEKTSDRTIYDSLQVIPRLRQSFFHQGQPTPDRLLSELPHPYADRMLVISESHSLGSFRVSGFCEAEVRNIQVAGSSCYITELGICNRNCAFDELTQHPRESYSYLFSRLRRLKDSRVPVRMRSATNPGGKFGDWVKEDFIPDEYLALSKEPDKQFGKVWEKRTDCAECNGTGIMDLASCIYCEGFGYRTRYFVPSRIQDNPSIDMAEYLRSLINLPPVERYRLEKGDWTVSELGDLFKPEWARYYTRRGDHFVLHRPDQSDIICPIQELTFFVTADTASKEKTTADFTAISTWAFHQRSGCILLIHSLMSRMEVPRIADAILAQSAACQADFVMIEEAQCGIGVVQELRGIKGKGIAVLSYNPNGSDKIARSTTAQVKMAAGQIFFPAGSPGWLTEPWAQLIGFPQATHDDFVDTLSMAASWAHSRHHISCAGAPGILQPVGRYLAFDTVHGITTYRAR